MRIPLLAKIAGRMPYVVQKTRYFKHFRQWPRLKGPVEEMPTLWHYIVSNGIRNRNNPWWQIMADKYAAREEVEKLLGPGHLIPLIGKWDQPEKIEFDKMPDSYILKTNNGCGTNIIVHDNKTADRHEIIKQLKRALGSTYPQLSGQLHYGKITPCVIAEELIHQDVGSTSLIDYKIHCVNGEPQTIYVFSNRDDVEHFKFDMKGYTANWRLIPPYMSPKEVVNREEAPDKPEWLEEMLDIARKLSAKEEYVRVDLYHTAGVTYFGEMTFMPDTNYHVQYHPYQKAMKYILEKIIENRNKENKGSDSK